MTDLLFAVGGVTFFALSLGLCWFIELANRRVTKNGELVHLTPIEYSLLTMFVKHPDKVLTHRMLLESVWGPTYVRHNHYVRVHVAELRKKIETDPVRPKFLVTESGVGYRWVSM